MIWTGGRIKLVRTIDGDTLVLDFNLGFHIHTHQTVRLARINTYELRSKVVAEKEKAYLAKEWVQATLSKAKEIKVVTFQYGKYNRILVDVWADNIHINKQLIEDGLAKPLMVNKARPQKKL